MVLLEIEPIDAYIDSTNRRDIDAVVACFAENAIVRDEGKDRHGQEAIRLWASETIEEYGFTLAPLSCEASESKTTVTMKVEGRFPGSPIELHFTFTVEACLIVELNIR